MSKYYNYNTESGALEISAFICSCKLFGRDAGLICYRDSVNCYTEERVSMVYYFYTKNQAIKEFNKLLKQKIKTKC